MSLKTKRLYWHALEGVLFDPNHGNIVLPNIILTRQDVTLLKVHACSTYDFTLASDGTVPTASQWSLSEYTGTPIFAIKTAANFEDQLGFAQSWTTFYSSSLSTGVFTMAIAPASTLDITADYVGAFKLYYSATMLEIPDMPQRVIVPGEVVVGTESGAPTGTGFSGTAQITAGNSSVAVTITGLTTSAVVVISLLGTSTDFTSLAYTPTTDTLTINASAAAPAGGYYNVAYTVISL